MHDQDFGGEAGTGVVEMRPVDGEPGAWEPAECGLDVNVHNPGLPGLPTHKSGRTGVGPLILISKRGIRKQRRHGEHLSGPFTGRPQYALVVCSRGHGVVIPVRVQQDVVRADPDDCRISVLLQPLNPSPQTGDGIAVHAEVDVPVLRQEFLKERDEADADRAFGQAVTEAEDRHAGTRSKMMKDGKSRQSSSWGSRATSSSVGRGS